MGTEVYALLQSMNEDYDKFELLLSSVFRKFVDKLSKVMFRMPSSLLSNVQSVIKETTSDEDLRKYMVDSILPLLTCVSKRTTLVSTGSS